MSNSENEKLAMFDSVKHLSNLQNLKTCGIVAVVYPDLVSGTVLSQENKQKGTLNMRQNLSFFYSFSFFSPGYGGCLIPHTWL